MAIFPGSAIPSAVSSYDIDNSCRFYSGTMTRTPSSQGSLQKLTISMWVKAGVLAGGGGATFGTVIGGDGEGGYSIRAAGELEFYWYAYGEPEGSRYVIFTKSIALFRDPAAWYHVVIAMDTTQAVDSNRARMYVNGEYVENQAAPYLTNTPYPPINYNTGFNKTNVHTIGSGWKGYISDFYYVDGTQYDPDDFGELNSATNQWVPLDSDDVKDAITFGTNGFYLDFADSAALGDDDSGEGNDWAVSSLDANDQMIDTPTNNFATLNPIRKSVTAMTISEGNLQWSGVGTNYTNLVGTVPMMSGKWYFEICNTQVDSAGWIEARVGLLSVQSQAEIQGSTHDAKGTLFYQGADGKIWCGNGTGSADNFTYGNTYTDGDIIGIAVNMTDSQVTFYKNNTAQNSGTPFDFSNMTQPYGIDDGALPWVSGIYVADSQVINFGQDSSFAGNKTPQGNQDSNSKGDFYYAPPSGFLALCTDNLSAPEIALPEENFNTVLYTGDGATTQAITGVGFEPEFLWTKKRSATGFHALVDSVRGATNYLSSNSTNISYDDAEYITSLDSDGFTVGVNTVTNDNTETFVSWNWKAGTSFDPKTDGTIAVASGSKNTTAGFSIVGYTGEGGSQTVGHGLGVAPELILIKN